jgi:Protein of unknown function (DUF4054)
MALPTVDEFRERFPEFDETSDELIEFALADAGDGISDTIWMEKDYANGVMFLAAHFLTAGTTQSEVITSGESIRSESIGRISTTYGDAAKSSDYASTEYGNRYLRLLRRNAPRMAVV